MKNNSYESLKSQIIKASGGKISGADVEKIKDGNLKSVNALLSEREKKLLLAALRDKQTAKRILDDPAVKDILNGKKGF